MTNEPAAPRSRIGSWTRALIAVVGVLCYAVIKLATPVFGLVDQSHTRLGLEIVHPSDSLADVYGTRHPAFARDSATLILLVDAHCAVCRRNAREYVKLADWSSLQGIATRLVLPNTTKAAAQFGRLGGDESAVLTATNEFFVDRLRILSTPSFVLVDRRGRVRGRWLGAVPNHLELLNSIGRIKS